MKIHLNQCEIEEAITDFIANKGLDLSNQVTNIELTAGRGSNGHYADIDLDDRVEIERGDTADNNPFDTDEMPETLSPFSDGENEVDNSND